MRENRWKLFSFLVSRFSEISFGRNKKVAPRFNYYFFYAASVRRKSIKRYEILNLILLLFSFGIHCCVFTRKFSWKICFLINTFSLQWIFMKIVSYVKCLNLCREKEQRKSFVMHSRELREENDACMRKGKCRGINWVP